MRGLAWIPCCGVRQVRGAIQPGACTQCMLRTYSRAPAVPCARVPTGTWDLLQAGWGTSFWSQPGPVRSFLRLSLDAFDQHRARSDIYVHERRLPETSLPTDRVTVW